MANAPPYDLFISYADADREWVEGYLLDALHHAGVRCHTEAAFTLGVPRLLEFERAVGQSERTLLVLSPAFLAANAGEFITLLAARYGEEAGTWPVIPLVLHPVELPPRLAMLVGIDATDPVTWPAAIERLLQRPPPTASPPACPYPGMRPFREDESDRFFGREAEVQDLLARLRLHPFLAVIGPSGSGKSSLVFAGLVPELKTSRLFGTEGWQVKSMRPGATPLAALAGALGGEEHGGAPAQVVSRALAAEPGATRLLLIVDQFEELFTRGGEEAVPFCQRLLALAETPDCFVVITVRADFYPDLMTVPLWPAIRAHRAEVLPLDEDGLREAIVQPAASVGVYVEAALVERLVADAEGEPGVLPLVQETLLLLWERLERRFLPLRAYEALVLPRSAYGATGGARRTGLQVAMARRADAALAGLAPGGERIARRIFLRLVEFGQGRADTRRQQPVTALRSADDDPRLFEETLSRLVDARLLTLSGAEGDGGTQVDLAHEALISGWPTLQGWLADRRDAEQARRRLDAKVEEWQRLRSAGGGLLDTVELLEAERWLTSVDAADVGHGEELPALMAASRAAIEQVEQEREAARQRELAGAQALAEAERRRAEQKGRTTRWLTVAAAALAVLAILATGASFYARRQQQRAAEQARFATARQLTAQALTYVEDQPDLAALLSLEAANLAEEQEQRSSLLTGVARNSYLQTFLRGHSGEVKSVAFSPDGARLATGGDDMAVILRNVAEPGAPGRTLTGHTGAVWSVAFSADGGMLASAGGDRTVRLWDAATGAPLAPLGEHGDAVRALAFSPTDGRLLVSAGEDGAIRLWDLGERRPLGVLSTDARPPGIVSLAFSPDGATLAAGRSDGDVMLIAVGAPELRQRTTLHPPRLAASFLPALSLAFSPDGLRLAQGSATLNATDDNTVDVWDLSATPPVSRPFALVHKGSVTSVAFDPAGRTIASGGIDRTVRVWNVESGREIGEPLRGHGGPVWSIAFPTAQATTVFASGSADQTAILWNSACGGICAAHARHADPVNRIALSPDRTLLASGGPEGIIRLWDMESRAARGELEGERPAGVFGLAISRENALVASGHASGRLILWNTATREPDERQLQDGGHPRQVLRVVFSPDGKLLASSSRDLILLWDVESRRQSGRIEGRWGNVWGLTFSPDSRSLAWGSRDGTIRLQSVASPGSPERTLTGHRVDSEVKSLAFSPDGALLASGSSDGTIKLWDVRAAESTQPLQTLDDHIVEVWGVAFSPDSTLLASADITGNVILWDLDPERTQRPVTRLTRLPTAHTAPVTDLFFAADGRSLVSAGQDAAIKWWSLDELSLRQRACAIANRTLGEAEWQRFLPDRPYRPACATR